MKALGGMPGRIAPVYLLEAGLLGCAAILLALPVGVAGARGLSRWMALFLNFDIASFAIPAWVTALVHLAGLVVPLLAAALPVWLGTRVPIHAALATGPAPERPYGVSALDRALTRLSGPSRLVLLALRNTARHRLRSALTVATLAAWARWALEPRGVLIWLAIALAGAALASAWPAWQSSRITVREALAHE
jgi:putative ABC transport system permease protein